MKPGIIIQARMGSQRFPGKVLSRLAGSTVLGHCVRNCQQSQECKTVVVATSHQPQDQPIADYCRAELDVPCVRHSEIDVLGRFVHASDLHELDVIIRVCADCPFVDSRKIDRLLIAWNAGGGDYIGYAIHGQPAIRTTVGLPELITSAGLHKLDVFRQQMDEHVTWGCYDRIKMQCRWLDADELAGQKNTVDTLADLIELESRCAAYNT